jgi:hypothetical protein
MSVAELERMYGRNAQVELRSPPAYEQEPVYQQAPGYQGAGYEPEPVYQADPPYYDPEAYDDPVQVPVKRSPWLPVVVVMMLGIGALLGYGLYTRGLIPARLLPSHVAMQKTESLPIERDWKGLPALPHISTGVVTSISAAKPATPAPATETSDRSGAAAGPAARPMTSTEDNAATLEMIRRERERLDDPGGTQQPSTTGEATEAEAEPSPPGYIEAETP